MSEYVISVLSLARDHAHHQQAQGIELPALSGVLGNLFLTPIARSQIWSFGALLKFWLQEGKVLVMPHWPPRALMRLRGVGIRAEEPCLGAVMSHVRTG